MWECGRAQHCRATNLACTVHVRCQRLHLIRLAAELLTAASVRMCGTGIARFVSCHSPTAGGEHRLGHELLLFHLPTAAASPRPRRECAQKGSLPPVLEKMQTTLPLVRSLSTARMQPQSQESRQSRAHCMHQAVRGASQFALLFQNICRWLLYNRRGQHNHKQMCYDRKQSEAEQHLTLVPLTAVEPTRCAQSPSHTKKQKLRHATLHASHTTAFHQTARGARRKQRRIKTT